MDVANFTEKSKEAISVASNLAMSNNNPEIKDCHMVAAFLDDKGGVITMLFKKMDVNIDSLLALIKEEINKLISSNNNPKDKEIIEEELKVINIKINNLTFPTIWCCN